MTAGAGARAEEEQSLVRSGISRAHYLLALMTNSGGTVSFMQKANVTTASGGSVNVTDLRAAAQHQRNEQDPRSQFDIVFASATVVIEQEHDGGPFREHPHHDGDQGRWVFAYSTKELLTSKPSYQEADADDDPFWTFRTGTDLQRELPPEVGIVLDPGQPWTAVVRRPRLPRADGSAT